MFPCRWRGYWATVTASSDLYHDPHHETGCSKLGFTGSSRHFLESPAPSAGRRDISEGADRLSPRRQMSTRCRDCCGSACDVCMSRKVRACSSTLFSQDDFPHGDSRRMNAHCASDAVFRGERPQLKTIRHTQIQGCRNSSPPGTNPIAVPKGIVIRAVSESNYAVFTAAAAEGCSRNVEANPGPTADTRLPKTFSRRFRTYRENNRIEVYVSLI